MYLSDALRSLLSDFDVLPVSGLQTHSVRKRDVHTHSHLERLVSFTALHRYGLCLRMKGILKTYLGFN